MKRAPLFRPADRAHRPDPAGFSLADLVAALCAGCAPAQGIEAMLDRMEGRR
ncbi:MAG: hypothetical protein AB7U46_07995 [Paenirhodobacter sp.]|uniref:hypothetical protein n=1 Tax=Paenirhodobacter sp. TaxID=1965326 RepID=UPI003D147602